MAKQQSFADKAKAKSKSDTQTIKCVVSVFDQKSGSWKFRERFMQVKDQKEIENLKF